MIPKRHHDRRENNKTRLKDNIRNQKTPKNSEGHNRRHPDRNKITMKIMTRPFFRSKFI